ncbi:hypothetical protein GR211_33345 [Rhizobium leguminosarum]|nr:hypothetical protein [Rhizobium ruizarguesonis]NEJ17735.1 hypothetical protein [Rhizobium ruizarguesonis]NEK31713.1 hypothetical protein [Rhizobium ruizarguesonis]
MRRLVDADEIEKIAGEPVSCGACVENPKQRPDRPTGNDSIAVEVIEGIIGAAVAEIGDLLDSRVETVRGRRAKEMGVEQAGAVDIRLSRDGVEQIADGVARKCRDEDARPQSAAPARLYVAEDQPGEEMGLAGPRPGRGSARHAARPNQARRRFAPAATDSRRDVPVPEQQSPPAPRARCPDRPPTDQRLEGHAGTTGFGHGSSCD